jgi:ligand-binding sensor domain-containing protein
MQLVPSKESNSSDGVWCGLQDASGALWFGTSASGVYRYDSKGFMQFTVQDGLPSNTVFAMIEDRQRRLWFGTSGGLCRWDSTGIKQVAIGPGLGLLTQPSAAPRSEDASKPPTNQGPKEPAIWSLFEDSKGTVWIGSAAGLVCRRGGIKLIVPSGFALKA